MSLLIFESGPLAPAQCTYSSTNQDKLF